MLVVGAVAQRAAAECQITRIRQGTRTGCFQHTPGEYSATGVGVRPTQAQYPRAQLLDLPCTADSASEDLSRTRVELKPRTL